MTSTLKCLPLTGVSDGPYMLEPPGTLTALQNMRLRPGGYAEARGGMEKLKPSGGSSAEPTVTGGTPSGIQISTSTGWIRTNAGATWSQNLQLSEGNYLPFATGAVNDAYYFGADAPFFRIGLKLSRVAVWTVTIVYEYWNGAAWSALTTQETITWTAVTSNNIDTNASWQAPSDWAATVVGNSTNGNVLKYWMRIRISVSTAVTTTPKVSRAFGAWNGIRELYLTSTQPYSAGPNGKLMRYDQSAAGGTAQYFATNSVMYSSPESIPWMAAYRGRVFVTNPKETVRWDGNVFQNVGNVAPGTGAFSNRRAGAGFGAGIYRLYMAYGYGPCQNDLFDGGALYPYSDVQPLYGWSQATLMSVSAPVQDPNDASAIVLTAGNELIDLDWSALTIPSDASCAAFYMTLDLTGVAVGKRASVPAYRIFNFNRLGITAATSTTGIGPNFNAPDTAILYDNKPPKGCRFCFIQENRLILGGGPDGTWYASDPFLPDQFNRTFQFISFIRAQGGRDMGGCEFGGWGVYFTEDQTWGLQNWDQDVPYVIPIHSGVGCVAPQSAAVGDGFLIWLARDGVYLWDGSKGGPKNVSGKFKHTFASMNFEQHGGSSAVIHNHKYDLTLIDSKNGTIGAAYTLDLQTFEWATRTTNDKKVPLCLIHAPLGHQDAGVPHALYAKKTVGVDSGSDATSYSPCVAEFTTQDDGTNIVYSATGHFPLAPGATFSPKRAIAYYQSDSGWGTPSLAAAASDLGQGTVGTITTNTPDTGTDYSFVTGDFSQQSSGTSDLKVAFSVTGAAGGTIGGQRLFGLVLEGEGGGLRDGI